MKPRGCARGHGGSANTCAATVSAIDHVSRAGGPPLESYRLNPTHTPLESAHVTHAASHDKAPVRRSESRAAPARRQVVLAPRDSVGRGPQPRLHGRHCATPGRRRVRGLPAVLARAGRRRDRMPPTTPLIQKDPWGIANPSESETNIR